MLMMLDHVYPAEIISEVRNYISQLPVILLRERLVKLMYIITDLASHPSSLLAIGTPSYGIIPHSVLDLIYGGTFSRNGKFYILTFRLP